MSRVELRVSDRERREASSGWAPRYRQALDPGQGWALLQIARQLFNRLTAALDAHAHAPVSEVHDVPGEPEQAGLALDEGAIPHALYPPLHQNLGGALRSRRVDLP